MKMDSQQWGIPALALRSKGRNILYIGSLWSTRFHSPPLAHNTLINMHPKKYSAKQQLQVTDASKIKLWFRSSTF